MNAAPYTVEPRPDTGLRNGQLGMWLFVASEVMLFGGLFSAYALLRAGAAEWPHRALSIPAGSLNTALLIASSITIVGARRAVAAANRTRYRALMSTTLLLAALFLAHKVAEYHHHLVDDGNGPWTNTFFAIYYTLTGIHALHLVGGMLVMAYFLGPGARLWRVNRRQFENRIAATALYWNFVDVVWLVIFATLYLG